MWEGDVAIFIHFVTYWLLITKKKRVLSKYSYCQCYKRELFLHKCKNKDCGIVFVLNNAAQYLVEDEIIGAEKW